MTALLILYITQLLNIFLRSPSTDCSIIHLYIYENVNILNTLSFIMGRNIRILIILKFFYLERNTTKQVTVRTFCCKDENDYLSQEFNKFQKKIYISLIHFLLNSNQHVEIIKNRVYLHGIVHLSDIQNKATIKHVHIYVSLDTADTVYITQLTTTLLHNVITGEIIKEI